MAQQLSNHTDDWMFDDDAFPYPSEYDRERGEWVDRIERNEYEETERGNMKLRVSRMLRAFGRGNAKGDAA